MADPEPSPLAGSFGERRAAPRHRIGPDQVRILMACVDGEPYPARVRNISTGGVSLLLGGPCEIGTVLAVQLRNLSRNTARNVQVQVLYAVEHPNGDWVIGGSFVRKLTGEELTALL